MRSGKANQNCCCSLYINVENRSFGLILCNRFRKFLLFLIGYVDDLCNTLIAGVVRDDLVSRLRAIIMDCCWNKDEHNSKDDSETHRSDNNASEAGCGLPPLMNTIGSVLERTDDWLRVR
jgi:hypothetical protein